VRPLWFCWRERRLCQHEAEPRVLDLLGEGRASHQRRSAFLRGGLVGRGAGVVGARGRPIQLRLPPTLGMLQARRERPGLACFRPCDACLTVVAATPLATDDAHVVVGGSPVLSRQVECKSTGSHLGLARSSASAWHGSPLSPGELAASHPPSLQSPTHRPALSFARSIAGRRPLSFRDIFCWPREPTMSILPSVLALSRSSPRAAGAEV
jgi:hypothetical protein